MSKGINDLYSYVSSYCCEDCRKVLSLIATLKKAAYKTLKIEKSYMGRGLQLSGIEYA